MSDPQPRDAALPHEDGSVPTDAATAAPAAPPAHELTDAHITALLDAYLAGESDSAKLAQRTGLSQLAIWRWMAEPSSMRLIQGMMHMQEVGNQCFANLTHRSAIARLVQISRDDAKPDVARKACVDLLKAAPGTGRALNASRMLALDERRAERTGETADAKRPVIRVSQEDIAEALNRLVKPPARGNDDGDDDGDDRDDDHDRNASGDDDDLRDDAARRPCVITLRREPIPPRQDLCAGADGRTTSRTPRRDTG